MGFDSIVVNDRNGGVVASFPVNGDDQIMLVTDAGQLIRCPINTVRIAGRRTQGVTIFRVGDDEKVVAVSCIPGSSVEEDDQDETIIDSTAEEVVAENENEETVIESSTEE